MKEIRWTWIWAATLVLAVLASVIVRFIRPHGAEGAFIPALAMLVCLLSAGFDTAYSRIPNPLTYTAILAGLGLNCLASILAIVLKSNMRRSIGAVGAEEAWLGFALCAGIGVACLTFAGMGGGDVKLMVALGALLGFSQVGVVLLWSLAIAVPYAVINLLASGRLNGVLRAFALEVMQIVYLRRIEPVEAPSRTQIPLAVPMLGALVLSRVAESWKW